MTLLSQECQRNLACLQRPNYAIWVLCEDFNAYERYRAERPGLALRYLGRRSFVRELHPHFTRVGKWRRWNWFDICVRLAHVEAIEVDLPAATYKADGEPFDTKASLTWEY